MRIALLAVAASLGLVAPADAAQRFASPTSADSAGACASVITACTLTHAVNDAPAGGEIIVLPGEYNVAATLTLPAATFIHGQAGTARPVIHTTAAVTGLTTGYPGLSRIKYLEIDGPSGGLVSLNGDDVFVENLVLHDVRPNGTALYAYNAAGSMTVRDTIATAAGAGSVAMRFGGVPAYVRNVTAWATGANSRGLESQAYHFKNGMVCEGQGAGQVDLMSSILHGDGSDLQLTKEGDCGPSPTLKVSWSVFTTKGESGATIDTFGGHNLSLDPAAVFVSPGTDFHELPGAATIDAGNLTSHTGPRDVDDFPRVRDTIDIGAAEFIAPDLTITPASAGPTFNAAVNPRGLETTAVFEYGPTTAYGSASSPIAVGSDSTLHALSFAPPGLNPFATYHARVKASQGNVNYTRTLTSADVIYSPLGAASKPPAGTITVKLKGIKTKLKRGVATIVTKGKATCAAGQPACRLRISVKRGKKAFAGQSFSVDGGRTKAIVVKLSSGKLAKLVEAGKLKLRFTVELSRAGSTPVEKNFRAKVPAPPTP